MPEKYVRFLDNRANPTWGKILDDSDSLHVKAVELFNLELPHYDPMHFKFPDDPIDYERLTEQLKGAEEQGIVEITWGMFLPPVESPPNIWAAGLNYYSHGEATGQLEKSERPDPVIWFPKWSNAVTSHNSNIILPQSAPDCVDYEVELAVIIGRKGVNISVEEADKYIAAVTIANDVSARDVQGVYPEMRKNAQWGRAKSFNTFCPLGYWVTDVDTSNLEIKLSVNGKQKQNGRTSEMMYSVAELIADASKDTTLYPGTVLLTGTPKGTQVEEHFAKREPIFLKYGDIIKAEIEGLGALVNRVTAGPIFD